MYVVRIRGSNHGVSTIVHFIIIGMDDTDQLYLISFEAPEAQWNTAIQKGGPMLNYFVLGN